MFQKIYYNDNDDDINLFLNLLWEIFLNFFFQGKGYIISQNTDLSFLTVSQPRFLKHYL